MSAGLYVGAWERLPRTTMGLVCVGTSATVGGEGNRAELRRYVADLFGQPFDEGTILTEERQSIDDMLGSAIIRRHLRRGQASPNHRSGAPSKRRSLSKAQHKLLFGTAIESDYRTKGWRIVLAPSCARI